MFICDSSPIETLEVSTADKWCPNCERNLPLSLFAPSVRRKPSALCSPCSNIRARDRNNLPSESVTQRKCRGCKEVKLINRFNKQKNGLDGYNSRCVDCRADYDALRKLTRPERSNDGSKMCWLCERTFPLTAFRVRPSNADGRTKECRECFLILDGSGTPERAEKERARYRKHWTKRILAGAKYRAERDSVPFDLTVDDVTLPEFCPVLGIKLEVGGTTASDSRPTLDRKIPEMGYVRGNVLMISWQANRIKLDYTDPEIFERIAAYVRANQQKSPVGSFHGALPCLV